ncbi:hypothetical protein ACFO0S_09785 [Chryseomicrobium palamuruense]|uniref:DNA primase/nucleoside triphosphatase C-terminal domain-containing protein n=1 Tax=Chryseomicrobium palamuruense TaxID=682973 RepID=A0ABV8UVI3_9BACL
MKNKSLNNFKVSSLLRMAEITEDLEKRNFYLQEAENLLLGTSNHKELEEFKLADDSVIEFFSTVSFDELDGEPVRETYEDYIEFCLNEQFQPVANNEFSKQLQRVANLSTYRKLVDGKKITYFSHNKVK